MRHIFYQAIGDLYDNISRILIMRTYQSKASLRHKTADIKVIGVNMIVSQILAENKLPIELKVKSMAKSHRRLLIINLGILIFI